MARRKDTNPDSLALCIMLARGDHAAGTLLHKIKYWSQYGKAAIPGVEGKWCANDRPWWMREAQLTLKQYNRAAASLTKLNLIEKKQYPFAGANILHVRPSQTTLDFLAASQTWDVAFEVMACGGIPLPAWAKPGVVKPSLQEMIDVWNKEESLTPQEVGELAVYRQGMKHVAGKGGEYDFTQYAIKFMTWAIENWAEFAGKIKDAPQEPQIGFFCDHCGVAANAVMTADWSASKKNKKPDVPYPKAPQLEEPWFDEMEEAS
jgi:hypothetical protein